MNKILITTSSFADSDSSIMKPIVRQRLHPVFNPYGRKLTESELLNLVVTHQPIGLIAGTEPITANVIKAATRLKVISRCGVGLDNVDVEYAHAAGIQIAYTPDSPSSAVKELAIAFMFEGLRKISVSDRIVRSGQWSKTQGKLLANQTVGVIGIGRIGKQVAEFLHSYGCRVLGYEIRKLDLPWLRQVSLEELLRQSDIITLHVPNRPDTYHVINRQTLSLMKDDALIVNTARGEIIDEQALYEFLNSRPQAHACLDTFVEEPYIGPLASLNNVTLTPHIGSFTLETRQEMEREAVNNLVQYLEVDRRLYG